MPGASTCPRIEKEPQESKLAHKRRSEKTWGLLEWVADTCDRFKVDELLIEAKASGIPRRKSFETDIRRTLGRSNVRGDKVARALAVQPMFSQGMVYAPAREWAELVITEMSMFPAGRYDDLTDSSSMALKYLRDHGWGHTAEEQHHAETDTVRHRPRPAPRLYPC
jgi:predicted phage terminase large subunit-like protein